MHMEMRYQLPSLLTTVNYQTVAAFSNTFSLGQLISNVYHAPDKC